MNAYQQVAALIGLWSSLAALLTMAGLSGWAAILVSGVPSVLIIEEIRRKLGAALGELPLWVKVTFPLVVASAALVTVLVRQTARSTDVLLLGAGPANDAVLTASSNGDQVQDMAFEVQPARIGIEALADVLAVGDFDGNGLDDVAGYATVSRSLQVHYSSGHGEFSPGRDVMADVPMDAMEVGDFDGDGRDDLVTHLTGSAQATVILSGEKGSIGVSRPVSLDQAVDQAVVGDFDGDERDDLLTYLTGAKQVWVHLSSDGGSFDRTERVSLDEAVDQIVAGDFNGDEHDDFLSYSTGAPRGSVHFSDGDGRFQESQVIATSPSERVTVLDFNGDGNDDLLFACTNASSSASCPPLVLSRHDGEMSAPTHSLDYHYTHVLAGDFNADGSDDILWHDAIGARAETEEELGHDSIWLGSPEGTEHAKTPPLLETYDHVLVGHFLG